MDKSRVEQCIKTAKSKMPDILYTAAILEHQDVSRDEISALYFGAKCNTTKNHAILAVNVEQAMNFIMNDSGFNNCSELVKQLNKVIGYGLYPNAGKFRNDNMQETSKISSEMKKLNELEDVEARAVGWFLYLASSKLCYDGNSVVAFLVMNKILIENGYGAMYFTAENARLIAAMVDNCSLSSPKSYYDLSSYLKSCIVKI